MTGTILDVLFWVALVGATAAAVLARMLMNLAASYVGDRHPTVFRSLGAEDRSLIKGFSQEEGRVRRALAKLLVWGKTPEPLRADPDFCRMARHWRFMFFTALGAACVVVFVLVVRVNAAA